MAVGLTVSTARTRLACEDERPHQEPHQIKKRTLNKDHRVLLAFSVEPRDTFHTRTQQSACEDPTVSLLGRPAQVHKPRDASLIVFILRSFGVLG